MLLLSRGSQPRGNDRANPISRRQLSRDQHAYSNKAVTGYMSSHVLQQCCTGIRGLTSYPREQFMLSMYWHPISFGLWTKRVWSRSVVAEG